MRLVAREQSLRLKKGNLMTVELDEEEARLLYAVVIEKAQEHSSYANTSEVADRLCKLATRFERPTATPKPCSRQ